ncbi:MAG: imidazole glycerol phosphate synthase subunit HisH [Pseudomonadota bacterium]
MKAPEVTVIDYGVGNLLSVRRSLEHCGAKVQVTSDPKLILAAPRVVLPGVGAFKDGMGELNRIGLSSIVHEVASSDVPILGICLGMQMLFDESEEFGTTPGLGLIPGKVIPIPKSTTSGHQQKIPHIGWSELVFPSGRSSWDGTLLHNIELEEAVYFVHSYMASPSMPEHRIADCNYGGTAVAAVVARNNVFGCQFHPEKSGEVGLRVLRTFLGL